MNRATRSLLVRMHQDEKGAISVLVLLMIWCLVALIATIWNTAEEATRKQQLQTAADSLASAGATIMARALNETAAQNMIICQDASAEVIYNAIDPTKMAIRRRLEDELKFVEAGDAMSQELRKTILQRLDAALRAYGPAIEALNILDAEGTAGLGDGREIVRRKNEFRRARSVIAYMHDTYMFGAAPASGRPGAPSYNGYVGLAPIAEHLEPKASDEAILDRIRQFIEEREAAAFDDFVRSTDAVKTRDVPALMQQHRHKVFEHELQVRQQAMAEIDRQQEQFSSYYHAELAHFVLKNDDPQDPSPLTFKPPLRTAAEVPWSSDAYPDPDHHDIIRYKYPREALATFGRYAFHFEIDPINAHTYVARLWHPDRIVTVTALQTSEQITLSLDPNSRGWAPCVAVPIERYLCERVDADEQGIDKTYMMELDRRRSQELAAIIRDLMGLLDPGGVADLPRSIVDDAPDPRVPDHAIYAELNVPYLLEVPPQAIDDWRNYNLAAGKYRLAIHELWRAVQAYGNAYQYFVEPFASDAWYAYVVSERNKMAERLGTDREFMVLRTYELRYVPDWAAPAMEQSVFNAVLNAIVEGHLPTAARRIAESLVGWDPDGQRRFLDEDELRTYYYQKCLEPARASLRREASPHAQLIAEEWINRPWPYEITPPPAPPTAHLGLTIRDRQRYFTVTAAAREAQGTHPQRILEWLIQPQNSKVVATSQAETFNWMEFNDGYGATDRYDQVTLVPPSRIDFFQAIPPDQYRIPTVSPNAPGVHVNIEPKWEEPPYQRLTPMRGAPRAWRDASIGGWNWRTRLSLGDAIYPTMQENTGHSPDLREYLHSAGMSTSERSSFHELQLH